MLPMYIYGLQCDLIKKESKETLKKVVLWCFILQESIFRPNGRLSYIEYVIHIWKAMPLSYHLGYLETILVTICSQLSWTSETFSQSIFNTCIPTMINR